jgi:hypothetical protein
MILAVVELTIGAIVSGPYLPPAPISRLCASKIYVYWPSCTRAGADYKFFLQVAPSVACELAANASATGCYANEYMTMNAPRYMAIREGYVTGAWSAVPSTAMTSEKSRMVMIPCAAPITTVVPWHANGRPRRSTGIQQSGSGRVSPDVCHEIQPFASSHARDSGRVCEACVIGEVCPCIASAPHTSAGV